MRMMRRRTPGVTSTAGRLVLALQLEIPGITGQPSNRSLRRMQFWTEKLKVFRGAIRKHGLAPDKVIELLDMAESSMKVQIGSYKKVMEGAVKEEDLDLKVYEAEVSLTSCLYILQLGPEDENPFSN